jgi:hypothetical protein
MKLQADWRGALLCLPGSACTTARRPSGSKFETLLRPVEKHINEVRRQQAHWQEEVSSTMQEMTFDPPILLNREGLPYLPTIITTRSEATAVFEMLPSCGIHWCGVVDCLHNSTDVGRLRLALATALERDRFLSPDDVDACARWLQ